MPDNNNNLYYLEELSGYKVASDNYDVRDWDADLNKRTKEGTHKTNK